ncbi:MAG: YbhB/YbcL family Raf kinase inhibitor-like protein [Gemmatimonadota bacterium]
MTLVLISSAFVAGAPIPVAYTCDGKNEPPPLTWSGAPPTTRAFALIVDDPDAPAGTWVHWVLYNLPADATGVPQNQASGVQGKNDFGKTGYGGPCPPPGKPHRYFFKLYALDGRLSLRPGATKAEVERAMQGHVLAAAELIGTYARRR